MRVNKLVAISFAIIWSGNVLSQQIDQTYNQQIKDFTTDTRFLPKLVLDLPDHPTVPSPLKHFGHIIGAEGQLHRTKEIYGYYQKLAETSAAVHIQQMGQSEEGRPFFLVVIADPKSIEKLDHYKSQTARLADPLQEILAENH